MSDAELRERARAIAIDMEAHSACLVNVQAATSRIVAFARDEIRRELEQMQSHYSTFVDSKDDTYIMGTYDAARGLVEYIDRRLAALGVKG